MPEISDDREQVVNESNAYQIDTMLQGVVRCGTGEAAVGLWGPVSGKTGTTNDVLDAWFLGFTPGLAVAVWFGFDKPRSLGSGEKRGVTATPIFRDFLVDALKGVPPRDFARPKSIVVVGLGNDFEYYKRGTEPGTGNGRTLNAATAMVEPGQYPEVGTGTDTVY